MILNKEKKVFQVKKSSNKYDKKVPVIICRLIFAKKITMETTKKNTGLYWILFLLSVAAFFLVLYSPIGAYCSMVLPFNTTFLAKALELM